MTTTTAAHAIQIGDRIIANVSGYRRPVRIEVTKVEAHDGGVYVCGYRWFAKQPHITFGEPVWRFISNRTLVTLDNDR